MKKRNKYILISLSLLLLVPATTVLGLYLYDAFNSKNKDSNSNLPSSSDNETNKNMTKTLVSLNAPNELDPKNTILSEQFVKQNESRFINIIKNQENFLNLPDGSQTNYWQVEFDEFLGMVTVSYQTNKYFSNGKVIDEPLDIVNDIKGFKKNEINVQIFPNNKNDYTQGSRVEFNVKLTDLNNKNITDLNGLGLRGKWTITPTSSISENGLSCNVILGSTGNYILKYSIYKDHDLKWSSQFTFFVNQKTLTMPSESELLINNGKELKGPNWISTRYSSNELIQKLNDYGVENTFSLITMIYADSNIMSSSDFNNIKVSFLENINYDKLKFQITGIANKDLSKFGRFPFPTLIEGWEGATLKNGDSVKVVFEYVRDENSNCKGQNKFDPSKVVFGSTLSSSSTVYWNKVGCDLNLPYLNGFSAKCYIYVNDKLVKSSNRFDNRVHFSFIFNFVDNFNNRDWNVVCDNRLLSR